MSLQTSEQNTRESFNTLKIGSYRSIVKRGIRLGDLHVSIPLKSGHIDQFCSLSG